jgi:hypothetical protein
MKWPTPAALAQLFSAIVIVAVTGTASLGEEGPILPGLENVPATPQAAVQSNAAPSNDEAPRRRLRPANPPAPRSAADDLQRDEPAMNRRGALPAARQTPGEPQRQERAESTEKPRSESSEPSRWGLFRGRPETQTPAGKPPGPPAGDPRPIRRPTSGEAPYRNDANRARPTPPQGGAGYPREGANPPWRSGAANAPTPRGAPQRYPGGAPYGQPQSQSRATKAPPRSSQQPNRSVR